MSIKCNESAMIYMYISLNQLKQVHCTNTYANIYVIVNTLLEPNVLWHYTCSSKYIEPMVLKFSQTQYLFSLTFYFLYNPRFAHIKGFSTPKKTPIYFDYMYIRINPKSFHARYSYLTQNVKLFVWYLVKRLQGFQPRYSGRKLLFIAIRRSAN